MKIYNIIIYLVLLVYSNKLYSTEIIRDSEIETVIKRLSAPIFTTANIDSESIKVFVINNTELNAYIIDNNNIFINSGLLQFSSDPHVILGVIAHEVGHIVAKHVLQRTSDFRSSVVGTGIGYILGIITAIAVNPDIGQALVLGSNNIGQRIFLRHTRMQEEVADQYALHYLDSSSYSNIGLINILQYFSQLESHLIDSDQYLLTHPASSIRLVKVQNYRRKNKVNNFSSTDIEQFKRIVEKLNAFLNPISKLVNQYNDNTNSSRYVRSIIYYRQSQISKSIKLLDSLISDSPQDPYFHELKAQILYKVGRIKESVQSYNSALLLSSDDLLIKLELSQALLLYDQKAAVNCLEQIVNKEDTNTFIWKQLAVAYGKIGNLGMSYFALTNKAFIEGDTDRFKQYVSLSTQHLPKNSTYLIKINDMVNHIPSSR